MKLTKDEKEYLADKVFWDWKRSEVDVWSIDLLQLPEKRAKQIRAEEKWYKSLYEKLLGEKV